MDCLVIQTATNDELEAKELAHKLVENKMAASVQIGKIESIYSYNNKIVDCGEWVLTITTSKKMYDKIEQFIKSNHHYETPCCIAFKIDKSSKEIKDWINNCVN